MDRNFTFEEFNEIVNEVALNEPGTYSKLNDYASSWNKKDGFYIQDGKIIQKHISGGATGGNCWGDEAKYFSNDRNAEPFIPLDNILKSTAPDISYLKYKEIENLIVEGEDCDREYYGNYTNYDIYSLDIEKLYEALFPREG